MEDNEQFNPYIKVPPGEEIVISGIAGRFPESDNMKQLQENLLNKKDLGSNNSLRWDSVHYDMPTRSGKVNNVEKFDAEYFNIAPADAHVTDPMCRTLLEHTYEAIIDAGVNPKELKGTNTGVFIGACFSETANLVFYYKPQVAGHPIIGYSGSWLANSISNWLGVTGPSYVVDTACSSGIYALAEAYRIIRNGQCDAAIVGAANLCLHPNITFQFYHLGVLSADGYCRPFDENGSGYMRSEAIAVVYLQKAKDARRIYATYVYAKTNCDGFKQEGVTYPSLTMQRELLETFYDDCGRAPADLAYMEAHGTGTLAGDPIEVASIDQAICSKRTTPLLMGSVKSNLGHSEPTSGVCQVAKVLIAMETGIIPPNIHYEKPRKELTAIIEGRINILTEPTSWNGGYVGINSFGFGGANSHVLLKSNPKSKTKQEGSDDLPRLVVASGRTEEAVETILDDVNSRQLDVEYVALLHCIHAEDIDGHPYRGYTVAGSKVARKTIKKVETDSYIKKPICFVFSGTDVTWCVTELMKLPVFAKAIEKCDETLKEHGMCVTDIVMNTNKIVDGNLSTSFVATIAVQIGLVDLLTHIGIVPDYMIGHFIGDLICEYVDGYFNIEETILMAYYMGIAFDQSKIQVVDIIADRCKHRESVRSKFLEYVSHLILPQFSKGRGIISLGRSRIELNSSIVTAEYCADSILHPIPLKKVIPLMPKNAILVEMVPYSVFRSIIAESSQSLVTLISLCKHGQKSTIQDFLEGIGDFYNIGLQPQISNLYPPVQFPVSRGTPMISHLVRWEHSEDYFLFDYKDYSKIFDKMDTIHISTADEEYEFMSGHVIDDKSLFPATGYLFLIWDAINRLSGTDFCKIPIVFENVKFIRATHLSKRDKLEFTFMIHKSSNYFEIVEQDSIVVSGIARLPDDIATEKLPVQFLPESDDIEEYMKTTDIYKELRLRGYQYTGPFRLLKSASTNGTAGHIKWQTNWVTFMDNMMQIKILSSHLRYLFVPTHIQKLVIDPTYHMMQIQDLPIGERVHVYNSRDVIISGGIEIYGLRTAMIPRRLTRAEAIHEEYRFAPYRDHAIISLPEAVKMSVHIALECYELINVKIIEYIEDNDNILPEDLIIPVVETVLYNLPLVRSNLTLAATANRFDSSSLPSKLSIVQPDKVAKDDTFLMVIAVGILTNNKHDLTNRLLSIIMAGGFLLSREDLSGTYDLSLLQRYNLSIILEKRTERETLVLLRKTQMTIKRREVVPISNFEFSWIDNLKSLMDANEESTWDMRVIIVAEGDTECGVLGFVNCLRKEPGGEIVRCIFIQDKDAPKFSLQEPFYIKQLQLDLPMNVLRPGKVWGSYRHFSLCLPQPRPVQYSYVSQKVLGDLSTFQWVEGRLPPTIKHENLIDIVYASLNFRDVMLATGKLAVESVTLFNRDISSLIGFEFVGFNPSQQRVMALCLNSGLSNISCDKDMLFWIIPDKWTFEEAATIPCVYATSCYALYIKGQIKKTDKILIHSGTGGVGQAAINLALHEGCEIFTTVGTPDKRKLIRELFPSIPDDHIGNSHDTSFEQMIAQQTCGRGVDIVLNSLAEEKLQASVRCLAKGGKFLEIGKYDLISNNTINKMEFARGISFHGVMLDNVMTQEHSVVKRSIHNYLLQGFENGAIKPLARKVFEKTEIEDAFRYMASGKHTGKILIKVRDENEPLDLPIFAYPQFFCEPHKSYIILGGLGGFGLELADWLVLRQAQKLLLISRTGIRNGYQRSRVELWKSHGVNVQIIAGVDASDPEDCAFILKSAAELGPVDAIFNLAVVLKDAIYKKQTIEFFEESLKPKAMIAKTLDELSRRMCPDLRHFVLFSSISCGRGNIGQTNYGMANSIMERICEKRVQDGFPAMAIQWGAVGDVGLVADMQEDNKELVISGTLQQRIQSCLQSLDAFLIESRPIVGSMVVAEKQAGLRGEMNILETVASIIGLKNIESVGFRTPLSEIGIDSMVAIEIKQTLEREFDVFLTAQDIQNLTFQKLHEMVDADKRYEEPDSLLDTEGIKFFIQLLDNLVIVPDICLELPTMQEMDRERIFFVPGIEGCGSVFNTLSSKIKAPATCLQHGVNNIPNCESVIQSAATLLPHILTRMTDSAEFLLVGYSYGTLITIELARLLEAKNLTGRLIFIDGTPNWLQALKEQYFPFTTIQEQQNNIILGLIDVFQSVDNTMVLLELSKYDTWEEKVDALMKVIPKEILNLYSIENYKIYLTSIYKHISAIHEYNSSSYPLLKSPILLLKSTTSFQSFSEEDYGLSKITEGRVQIHYVEGNHVTILENNLSADVINGDINI